MRDLGRIEAKTATIAGRQYGHATRAQLLEAGLDTRTISRRIEKGGLIVVHAGVYAVGHPRPEPIARAAAALLACGPGAVLSHGSAAVLWGFGKGWPEAPEVTTRWARRRPGIRCHRSTTLIPKDIRRHRGLRVTSPARALLEIAPRLSDRALKRAFNDARLAHQVSEDSLDEAMCRLSSHAGTHRLRAVIETAQAPTRSVFEDEFVVFAARHGLPKPKVNAIVAEHEVDVLFERERVIVELDGWEYHGDRASFEGDRARDADTLAAGHVTVRLTWARYCRQPNAEAARLQDILRARRAG